MYRMDIWLRHLLGQAVWTGNGAEHRGNDSIKGQALHAHDHDDYVRVCL